MKDCNDSKMNAVNTVAIIPARGNSKGVPGKNKRLLGDMPLFAYTLTNALLVSEIDLVIVTTEDNEIEDMAMRYGSKTDRFILVHRPMDLAMDIIQLDDVYHHVVRWLAMDGIHPKIGVALAPTSPFRDRMDIKAAIELYQLYDGTHTIVGVEELDHEYYWKGSLGDLSIEPLGHKPMQRLGRQWETDVTSRENGSIYVFNAEKFMLKRAVRMAPYAGYYMSSEHSLDINTPYDWDEAERIIESR